MKYFIANLIFHCLVSVVLIILIIIFTGRNRKRRTRHPITYFLPFVLSAIAVAYTIKFTAPRLLDISDVMSGNYYSYTGQIGERAPLRNHIYIDDMNFYINPIWDTPEEGTPVRIRYTRYGQYIMEISDSEEVNIPDSISEEMQTSLTAEG